MCVFKLYLKFFKCVEFPRPQFTPAGRRPVIATVTATIVGHGVFS